MSFSAEYTDEPISCVLVVDDEADIRQMVAICLNKSGFKVETAENAVEAHKLLVLKPYDAIVTDVMMPGEDGIAFLGRVHLAWPEIPVILMTGHAQLQMAVNAIKNGAFDFVYKPFDFAHLRKIVERAVNYTKLQKIEKNYRNELEDTIAKRTSELKEAMAELDFAHSALLRVANEKSNFMANISHEMRTPMNGVIGSLDLIAKEGVSGIQAEYLAMARQSADDMVAMINELLEFNNKGGPVNETARYDLIDLTGFLSTLVSDRQSAFMRKSIELKLVVDADVPYRLWTDREQLLRLLEILLGNALKFTESGSVTMKVFGQNSVNNESTLHFSVIDSGIGIPEGMLEKIFEPFVQVDGSFARSYGGVGLGLSIARQIAILLNGDLVAEHAPGGGSIFKVTLKILAP